MVMVWLLLTKVGMAMVEMCSAVLLLVEVEGVVEVAEEVVHVKVVELRPAAPVTALLEGGAAKLVVLLALLGVRQDLVSLRNILELLLGPWLLVLVRVVLEGQLAERLLDLPFSGRALDTQQLVVVLFLGRTHC